MDQQRQFYRYVSLVDELQIERARESIVGSTLYLAQPKSFNDPFEFAFALDYDGTPDQWRAFLADPEVQQRFKFLPKLPVTDQVIRRLIEQLKRTTPNALPAIRERTLSETVVCCLSSVKHHPLLWAHYADGHKGLCLEYTQQGSNSLFAQAQQVVYRDQLPVIGLPDLDYDSAGKRIALTKATCWSYEGEWRIVISDIPPGPRPYLPSELTAVILGHRTTDAHVNLVREWLRDRQSVRLLRARTSDTRFSLSIVAER